jgi:ribosomal protein S18 acetylase RimI-like enzyme
MSGRKLAYQLRQATDQDDPFIRKLYIDTMQPLLSAFGAWDTDKNLASFDQHYRVAEATIIVVDGADVGWLQIHDDGDDLSLHQLHIVEAYRNRGIGTRLIRKLIARADRQTKRVTLSVVKNNRALSLYQRLGFRIVGEDETKYHLRR